MTRLSDATPTTHCPPLAGARRVVVKIGSALLTDAATGALKRNWLASLVEDVAELAGDKREIILVSSGAIALGRHALGLAATELRLEESQAAASVGQIALAQAYSETLAAHGLTAAQILLTLGDTEERRRYLNARSTLETLLKLGTVPIVNENDTVATSEIRYGDNDRLAARVASMTSADCLVLLSDVDGLYTAPPAHSGTARHFAEVTAITPQIEAMAGDAGTALSRGGMKTKIEAARIATGAGAHMIIASGKTLRPLRALGEGAAHTWFHAEGDPAAARKRWISGSLKPTGHIVIDDGAANALGAGKSLLPAGIVSAEGDFLRGDAVAVRTQAGVEIARGLVAYSAGDVAKLAGCHSSEIESRLGHPGRAAAIHRDDLVLTRR